MGKLVPRRVHFSCCFLFIAIYIKFCFSSYYSSSSSFFDLIYYAILTQRVELLNFDFDSCWLSAAAICPPRYLLIYLSCVPLLLLNMQNFFYIHTIAPNSNNMKLSRANIENSWSSCVSFSSYESSLLEVGDGYFFISISRQKYVNRRATAAFQHDCPIVVCVFVCREKDCGQQFFFIVSSKRAC